MGKLADFVSYYSNETVGSQTPSGILSEIRLRVTSQNINNNSLASILSLSSNEYTIEISNVNQITGLLKNLIP